MSKCLYCDEKSYAGNILHAHEFGHAQERVRVREAIEKIPENVDGSVHFNSKEEMKKELGLVSEVRR